MTGKFFSVKSLGSPLGADQRVVKAADYEQLVQYETLLQQLQNRHQHREKVMSAAMGKSIQRGMAQGMERANQKAAEQMLLFTAVMDDYLQRVEQELVEVVISAVRRIFHSFDDATLVQQVVQSGMEMVKGSRKLHIRVHPSVQMEVEQRLEAVRQRFAHLEVIGDGDLNETDCILESDIGIVNAGLWAQLEVIEQTLRGLVAPPAG
jgi:type III secretion protein L